MADLSITAANVQRGAGNRVREGTAGVAITAGQSLYVDTADSDKLKLADCDNASAIARTFAGIALHAAAAGQPIDYQYDGPITIGTTVAPGVAYYLSPTAGGICPVADLSTGDYPTLIGFGISASVIDLNPVAAGVALG